MRRAIRARFRSMQSSKFDPKLRFSVFWPVLAAIVACAAVNIPEGTNRLVCYTAWYLSWPGYNGWLTYSIVLVLLPMTPVIRSVKGSFWARAWPFLDILLCAFIVSQVAKYTLRWPRPSGGPSGAVSGHSMCAVGLAWILSKYYPRWAPVWFAMAASVAWSRAYIGEHYPYQVVLGVLLGMVAGYLGTVLPDGLWCPRCFKWLRREPRVEQPTEVVATGELQELVA